MNERDEQRVFGGEPTQNGEPAVRYWALWRGGPSPDLRQFLRSERPSSPCQVAAVLRVDQRERWRSGQKLRASDYLHNFPEVRADDESAVELIYGEFLLREEFGESPTLEEYRRDYPEHAARLATQIELHRALETASDHPDDLHFGIHDTAGKGSWFGRGPEGLIGAPAEVGRSFGAMERPGRRFQILRRHARGGVGEVFVAFDRELSREVALKVMTNNLWSDPDRRGRFVREAEITGALEHPGIIPVYSLGSDQAGQPYYAMRFIRGDSLLEGIARYYSPRANAEGPSARALGLRQLLRRFVDTCNAVGYAHSRGVLHRDLKPANILLGPHGETLVIDWGLAKAPGGADPAFGPASAGDHGEPAPGASPDPTRSGALIGTPAYMSPEQAEGRPERLSPASDVYSLGATLYHVLTGRAPFSGATVAEVIEKVRRGDFPAPRAARAGVPPALEAICLMAMARDPAARYASTTALADDIECWLADEPTSARSESVGERLARWSRRHRAFIGAASLALTVITALSVAAAVLIRMAWWSERAARRGTDVALRAEQAAHAEALRMRELADANSGTARRAVEDFFTKVSENSLMKQQDLYDVRQLRKELLESAVGFYQTIIEKARDDSSLRADLADAYFRVGRIRDETGSYEEARDAHEHARDLRRTLLAERPDDHQLRRGLGLGLLHLGGVYAALRQDAEADASYREANGIWDGLVSQFPDDHETHADQAETYHRIGILLSRKGRLDDALELSARARDIRARLVKAHPEVKRYRRDLVASASNVSAYHGGKGDAKASLASLESVRGVLVHLVAEDPTSVELQFYLAAFDTNIGATYVRLGKPAEAVESFRRAHPLLARLAANHPSATRFQISLATLDSNIGSVLCLLGKPGEALEPFEQSRSIRASLVAEQPHVPAHRSNLGAVLTDLARVHRVLGHRPEALRHNEQARQTLTALPAPTPSDHYHLACTYAQMSELVGQPGAPPAGADPTLIGLSLDALRRAAASGFKERGHVERDVDLDPVRRARPREFELFLMEISFPENPFAD